MTLEVSNPSSTTPKLPVASPVAQLSHHSKLDAQLATEDADLDHLDDNDLTSDEENSMALRNQQQMGSINTSSSQPGKLGEVANAIASCSALSFFSISMILANKVSIMV